MHAPIPDIFVPMHFLMDPKTDILVRSGKHLQNGMVVILEDDLGRTNPIMSENPGRTDDEKRRLTKNRWCLVEDLEISPLRYDCGQMVTFTGVYADGLQVVRRYNTSYAWYVKRNSLPEG